MQPGQLNDHPARHPVDDPDFPGGRALRISVYLSPYDVHLNRVPRAGTVQAVRYFPGRFLNARHRDCARVNEQLWVDLIDDDGRHLRVKQISGALARRLRVCKRRGAGRPGAGGGRPRRNRRRGCAWRWATSPARSPKIA